MNAKSIKEILSGYFEGSSLVEINKTINLEQAWKSIVGKTIAKNTKIIQLKKGTLTIKTKTPIWRNELSFQKQALLEKLQKKEPKLNIKEIILK